MNSKQVKFIFCFLLIILAVSFTTGCKSKKSNNQKTTKSSVKLSNSTKNITLAELLPKTDVVTGKYKKELPEKVTDEYMYGTLAGQYGKLDVCEEHLIKTLKMEKLFIEAHHNLGLCYYKQGRVNEAVKEWKQTLAL